MHPNTEIVRNGVTYEWSYECANAFQHIKDHVTKVPIIEHMKLMYQNVVETDASDNTIDAGLSQVIDGWLYPIGCYIWKVDKAEFDYDMHDNALHAMLAAWKQWRCYLKEAHNQILI